MKKTKRYIEFPVIGFVETRMGQAVLADVGGEPFSVLDGVNGFAAISPSGTSDGRIFHGGKAFIEVHADGGKLMGIRPRSWRWMPEDARERPLVDETEARRLVALEKPYLIIGRSLVEALGFSETEFGCGLSMEADPDRLENARGILADADIDTESGAVDDIDGMSERVLAENFGTCRKQPRQGAKL